MLSWPIAFSPLVESSAGRALQGVGRILGVPLLLPLAALAQLGRAFDF